jgi:hypothetical protein
MMSKFKKNLQLQAEDVKLNAGDMIIDHTLNSRGFLVKRKRYIDIIEDDIYVWEINWFKNEKFLGIVTETPRADQELMFPFVPVYVFENKKVIEYQINSLEIVSKT